MLENENNSQNPKAKVLLVDDDQSLSRLFQYSLSKDGFECVVANDASEGFSLAKSFLPDIIVSDIMMPYINGFEFRKMLMADPELIKIPFVFLTSKAGEDDILEGYDLGIADYVVKTAGPRVVVAKVSALMKSLDKEREKAVSELHKAADSMRVKVVPESYPVFDGYDIKHFHQPFSGVPGGDFIDYSPIGQDIIVLVLGDVMGKKWGAWYFAVAYAGYIRSALRVVLQSSTDLSPQKILAEVNNSIFNDTKISEVFATLSIVVLNKKTNILQYSGAGDLPLIHRSAETGEVNLISSTGLLLGYAADGDYDNYSVELQPDDVVFLITDGVIEARDSMGIDLGKDKLMSIIKDITPDTDPLFYLHDKLSEFTSGHFDDDVSIIVVKRLAQLSD